MGVTRFASRWWRSGLVAALAVWLLVPVPALACEATPLDCTPVILAPTGRPLELELGVGSCTYDTRHNQIEIYVTLHYPNGMTVPVAGTGDLGVFGSGPLVDDRVVPVPSGGRYGLEIEVLVTPLANGALCYYPGDWVFSADVPGATTMPRPTPRPTPRSTVRPTPTPTVTPALRQTASPSAHAPASLGRSATPPAMRAAFPTESPVQVVAPTASRAPGAPGTASPPRPTSTLPSWLPILLVALVAGVSLGVGFVVLRRHTQGEGPWVCPACHSLNEPDAGRCYSCHARRPKAGAAESGTSAE